MKRLVLLLLLCPACEKSPATTPSATGDPDEIPLTVHQRCPGGPGCEGSGDGKLWVGAAKRDITPQVEPFVDLNHNDHRDPAEQFTDLNGNGRFDPVWLAGRDSGTLAFGVHDPVWARCFAVRQNETTVAHCVLDAIGYFYGEVLQIRADLDPSLGVDLVLVGATHNHQNKDTLGQWGSDDTTTGYDPVYMRQVRAAILSAITEAVRTMKPARMSIASILAEDGPSHDMIHYVSDTRDPVVIDNRMHLMQFDGEDGKPIVTVINWAAHPDSLGSKRHYISSDFVHYLRETVEAGTGSDVVYVTGSVGGQIGPGRVIPLEADGTPAVHEQTYRFIHVWGGALGRLALKAFAARTPVESPRLTFRRTAFGVHVDNIAFKTGFILQLFHRDVYGYDPSRPLLDDEHGENTPLTWTEVAYLTLGPASIITCPGELLPELFLGGYDGSHSGTYDILDTKQPNSPNLADAPKPPYLIDRMDGPVEHRMVFGLTPDMLGYIVARFNFVLNDQVPYLAQPPGDHYEETNSVGPRAEPEIVGTMRQLVEFGR
ncbi:MAG: hypothetical protein EXR72_18515 [Myxococcales bacterium]|nr:hypothetical protein [Myxococcales bacterium]